MRFCSSGGEIFDRFAQLKAPQTRASSFFELQLAFARLIEENMRAIAKKEVHQASSRQSAQLRASFLAPFWRQNWNSTELLKQTPSEALFLNATVWQHNKRAPLILLAAKRRRRRRRRRRNNRHCGPSWPTQLRPTMKRSSDIMIVAGSNSN